MDRSELLVEMEDGRATLRMALAPLDDASMEQPVNGAWTRRDVLAHLEAWERRVTAIYTALRNGHDPADPVDGASTDELNARFFEESRDRSLGDVRRGETEAYEALVRLVEEAPDGDLFDAERFTWTGGEPFYRWILGNSSEHYTEHVDQLAPARV